MENPGAIVVLLLIGIAVIASLRYSHVRQKKREQTRTTDQLKAYRVMLLQSPDNELAEDDAAFVHTLFTPALLGQYEKRRRPITRQLRRLENEFQLRALGIKLVRLWQIENPDTKQELMPPDLRKVAEEEQVYAPEPKPLPPDKQQA